MAKTSMAKSVHDAAWTMFRTTLKYKAIRQCVVFEEVNEAFPDVLVLRQHSAQQSER